MQRVDFSASSYPSYIFPQQIWKDVDDVIIKVLMSGLSVLRHNYKTCFPNHMETSACFEILGFDIMLDRKLRPYVIEVSL